MGCLRVRKEPSPCLLPAAWQQSRGGLAQTFASRQSQFLTIAAKDTALAKLASVLIPLSLACAVAAPGSALAWGASGHRMIGEAAMQSLPAELPAFLRTPQAVADVGELSREPDRWKGAGRTHDANRDSGHFLDLSDDGSVLGGPRLAALPVTRADYEKALGAVGTDSWKAGYLPYSIVDQEQQLAKDFAYWRVLAYAEAHEKAADRKAWYAADRGRREALILSTLGQLSHYVGDGSQPLHVTIHFNGWGESPNPGGYTRAHIHGPFEGEFVGANIKEPAVRAAMPAPAPCVCAPEQRTAAYLAATGAKVEPLYQLEKAGGFREADPRGIAFALERVAAGAGELRDVIVEAWNASANSKANVGYPSVKVADVLAGQVDPYESLYGKD
jgi:hypothetical protein